jgi:hypothetical protein
MLGADNSEVILGLVLEPDRIWILTLPFIGWVVLGKPFILFLPSSPRNNFSSYFKRLWRLMELLHAEIIAQYSTSSWYHDRYFFVLLLLLLVSNQIQSLFSQHPCCWMTHHVFSIYFVPATLQVACNLILRATQ